MFIEDDSLFADATEIKSVSKFSRPNTASNRPVEESNDKDDEDTGFRSAGTLNSASSSRARVMAQQREVQLKKRQSALQNGGMVRSSIDSNASTGSPARNSMDNGQFTAVARQFSAPKSIKEIDQEASRETKDKPIIQASPLKTTVKKTRYSDDEQEEDDESDRRNNRNNNRNTGNASRDGRRNGYDEPHRNARDEEEAPQNGRNNDKTQIGLYQNPDDSYGKRRQQGNGQAYDNADPDYTYNGKGGRAAGSTRRDQRDYDDRRNDDDYDSRAARKSDRNGRNGGADDRESNMRWDGRGAENAHDLNNRQDRREGDRERERERIEHEREEATAMTAATNNNPPPRPIIVAPDLSNMRRFLSSPVPKNVGVVQCYIRRNNRGTNAMYPIYSLFLKEGDVFLMASKKRPKNKTSNYHISMDQNDLNRTGNNYLGKLRSNFVGTEFQIFDDGVSPKGGDDDGAGANSSVRCEMASVMYAANVLGSRGPRKMQVALPGLNDDGDIIKWRDGTGPENGSGAPDDMLNRIKDRNFRDMVYLINKPPRWNEQVGAYVLNFNGRVTMASVKNFQLVDPEEQNSVVLQFGRVAKDEFTMDLQWPISPFQAFAVTLSSFDSKIACD